ncbi:hypothetical protein M514_02941 [Trichuris suis]|uniref:Saposin B-type domain-containing protein n=1 Tax=Trichuris suis TaxID=68888 RepID=A0A085MG17_9BILA|nr:hypothetical protein M513_02941 [Trichuris suis]KFD66690.1 hypothetical protein M514_02941 [Trichuris suis]KHJ43900.1 hypothetical protein D918_05953 [Trichuris suis]
MRKLVALFMLLVAVDGIVNVNDLGKNILRLLEICGKCNVELHQYSNSRAHEEAMILMTNLFQCIERKCITKVAKPAATAQVTIIKSVETKDVKVTSIEKHSVVCKDGEKSKCAQDPSSKNKSAKKGRP